MRKISPFIWFIVPAVIVIVAVIVFPWLFTLWMSLFDWKIGSVPRFAGLSNYAELATNTRFLESIAHTLIFTALAVAAPLVLGTAAALVFHQEFPMRGFLRGAFVLPMMATPVAIALVWVMMFHPQQGVLNYLLSLVGIGPSEWVYSPRLAIACLVLVDIWQWTPLVMLIVLGGMASLPADPFEAALMEGASRWQTFRYVTLPMLLPFILVAGVVRMIDALKTFDTIYVITQGGPGTASETINIYLYLQAFSFYQIGKSSAVVVVFFVLVVALSMLLFWLRERSKYYE
ncbi:ABC transporter permease [Rhodoferax koreense]|uniref:ABC transporter permease n=1 Tax=Rhodoferax koreensis TaxID=1842727 RepID=A0A1P8K2W1_9BURK|nr:sugar ABC transporter permease [Rhodoferax koreense]APW40336.1 ABC transporter permease [Rhodoferax koreense]